MCKKGGSAPEVPVLPPPPDVPENAQAIDSENVYRIISGFYGEDGKLDTQKVEAFANQIKERTGQQADISGRAMNFLGSFLDQGPTEFDTLNQEIASAEQQAYLRAIRGDLPLSERLKQERKQQFQVLKESAGQRGIRIDGDDPASATSESTAGIRVLSEFNKRFDLAAENERQAEKSFGGTQNLNRIGMMENVASNKFNRAAGLADLANPAFNTALGFIGNATDLASNRQMLEYQGKLKSYDVANQNMMNAYNSAMQNYQASQAGRQGFYQSIGQLGGMAGTAMMMNPATMPWGAAVLGGTGAIGLLGR